MSFPVKTGHFAILLHTHPVDHFDLLFEVGLSLCPTWRLLRFPQQEWVPAYRLPDHRRIYLHYEGAVSNNRGTVTRVAKGSYELLEDKESELVFDLYSHNLNGIFRLFQYDHSETGIFGLKEERWMFGSVDLPWK